MRSAVLAGLALALLGCGGGRRPQLEAPTLVLVAVEGLTKALLEAAPEAFEGYERGPAPIYAYPGVNSALASLLLEDREHAHGVESIHMPGRHRVPEACRLLPELLGAQGWSWHGAVSLRQLSASISGLAQGCASWSDAHTPASGAPCTTKATLDALESAAGSDLVGAGPVGLIVQLSSFREGAPAPLGLEEQLPSALAQHRDAVEGLGRALDTPVVRGGERVRAVEAVLARRRGSAVWDSYVGALATARLAELEGALARVSGWLESCGRNARAQISVYGTPVGGSRESCARLWWKGEALENLRLRSFSTRNGMARLPDGGLLLEWGTGPIFDFELRAAGLRQPEREDSARLRPVGTDRLAGSADLEGTWAEVVAERPRASFVLEVQAAEEVEGRPSVLVGELPLSASFLPRLPDPLGEEWEPELAPGERPPWSVDVERHPGGEYSITIDAGVPGQAVRALLARYPEDALAELELASGAARATPIEGRTDAVWVEGETPLVVRAQLGRDARPALAVELDGHMQPIAAMRYRGRRWTRGSLLLLLPGWMPGVTDPLWTGPGPGNPESTPPPGTLRLSRGLHWDPALDSAPSPADQQFLRQLYPRE